MANYLNRMCKYSVQPCVQVWLRVGGEFQLGELLYILGDFDINLVGLI